MPAWSDRALWVVALVAALVVSTAACSSPAQSPLAPSPPADRVALIEGDNYLLLATASDLAVSPPCSWSSDRRSWTVRIRVSVRHEGTEWVARSRAPQDGDLELRFRDEGGAINAGILFVSGSIRGSGMGTDLFVPDAGLHSVSYFGTANTPAASVRAAVYTFETPTELASGTADGRIVYGSAAGDSAECAEAGWLLTVEPSLPGS